MMITEDSTYCPLCSAQWLVMDIFIGVRSAEHLRHLSDSEIKTIVENLDTPDEAANNNYECFNRSINTTVITPNMEEHIFITCPDCHTSWNLETQEEQKPSDILNKPFLL